MSWPGAFGDESPDRRLMRVVLVAQVYLPDTSSGAVQMHDLAQEFQRQGHEVLVMVPDHELTTPCRVDAVEGVQVLRLRGPQTRGDISLLRRAFAELWMPAAMIAAFARSPLRDDTWDAVAWYSPSIFLAPFVRYLKRRCTGGAYLILRDIFPDWAVDAGVMRRSAPYFFFKAVAAYQYSVGDVIGVQSPGNLSRLRKWAGPTRQVEVLHNWLSDLTITQGRTDLRQTPLAGRRLFVYAGNFGRAQGIDVLLEIAERFKARADVGFVYVGRGSEWGRLRDTAVTRGLTNVHFISEIPSGEIPALLDQCHIGLVVLHPGHRSHNIPGKLLAYLRSGLPVLASVNAGNDLIDLILSENVGRASVDGNLDTLAQGAQELLDLLGRDPEIADRCRRLAANTFSSRRAVAQIIEAVGPVTRDSGR